ncbi:MAG: universal stress protein [Oxalobacter sp.]|nr:MAG: universal stress protein [Oxalobacter sp.]
MPYKTILVHLDESKRAQERIKIASRIAMANNAHLLGVSMIGIATQMYEKTYLTERDPNLAKHIEFLRNRAMKAVLQFEETAKSTGVASYEGRVVDGEATEGLGLQARYCDLVVVGQSDPDEPAPSVPPDFAHHVVMQAGRPILIVPKQGEFATVGKRALISWDASRGAIRAVTDAIPLLQRAELVQIVVFNAEAKSTMHGDEPGADLALYLARHGVQVEVMKPRTVKDIGASLLAIAKEASSDLIVMGGYGHSRIRQMLLGGVTRSVLSDMTVPVMMTH